MNKAEIAIWNAACDACAEACMGLDPVERFEDEHLAIDEYMAADACRAVKYEEVRREETKK